MQAHVQYEFAASVREAVTTANRVRGGGWLRLTCRPTPGKPNKLSFFVDSTPTGRRRGRVGDSSDDGHDFTTDPWSRHVIQVEGETVPALVLLCEEGNTKHEAYLMVASALGRGGVPTRSRDLKTRVRSLGYIGPFLQQYGAAAKLLKGGGNGSRLLRAVAGASGQQRAAQGGEGTFAPADVHALDTSRVPLNPAQRDTVLGLTGGLDIIVGPPGTGNAFFSFFALCDHLLPIDRTRQRGHHNQKHTSGGSLSSGKILLDFSMVNMNMPSTGIEIRYSSYFDGNDIDRAIVYRCWRGES